MNRTTILAAILNNMCMSCIYSVQFVICVGEYRYMFLPFRTHHVPNYSSIITWSTSVSSVSLISVQTLKYTYIKIYVFCLQSLTEIIPLYKHDKQNTHIHMYRPDNWMIKRVTQRFLSCNLMSNIVYTIVVSGRKNFTCNMCKNTRYRNDRKCSQAYKAAWLGVYNGYLCTSVCSTPTGNPTPLLYYSETCLERPLQWHVLSSVAFDRRCTCQCKSTCHQRLWIQLSDCS